MSTEPQVFEAPPVVKAALCSQQNVNKWAAGTSDTGKHVERVIEHVRAPHSHTSLDPLIYLYLYIFIHLYFLFQNLIRSFLLQHSVRLFFTPESMYAKNKSQYGGGTSVSVVAVRDGTSSCCRQTNKHKNILIIE